MKFYCDNMKIRDEYGRERMFRGANSCFKQHNATIHEMKKLILDKATLNLYKDMGFNLIRLGITWAAIEPKENEYNDELIDILGEFCSICEENGIYVYLDMHQDVYSPYFHFDGAPKWAVNPKYKSQKPYAVWAEGYFYMTDVQKAFSDFWEDVNDVQTKFVKMWKYYTDRLSSHKNIIAYDYFNEPYINENGRILFLSLLQNAVKNIYNKDVSFGHYFNEYKDKKAFLKVVMEMLHIIKFPCGFKRLLQTIDSEDVFSSIIKGAEKYTESFDKLYYQKFIDRMDTEVNDSRGLTLFEHNYFANLGIPFKIDAKNNYVYSPHAYDFFIDTPLYKKYASDKRISVILNQIRQNQLSMNVPIIFGEWGGGGPGLEWFHHIDYILDEFDKNHWSNTYWGNILKNKPLTEFLKRPYAMAVCGDIETIKTDNKNRIFYLKWNCNKDFPNDIKTEIYVPNQGVKRIDNKKGINEITINY